MAASLEQPQGARFGAFEMDFVSGELRQNGQKVRLQEQPFRVLASLVLQANQLVTLEQLYSVLSGQVDAKHALHNAILKIREALGDSADSPRFLESIPRKGYRFIGQVDLIAASTGAHKTSTASNQSAEFQSGSGHDLARRTTTVLKKSWYYLVAGAVLVLMTVVFIVYEQEPSRAQLELLGWKVEGAGDGVLLTYNGVPGPESINILRRVRSHFTIKLITFEIDQDISGWASLKGLIGLDLSSTKIRNLNRLKNLKNLVMLNVSHNSFLTDISAIQDLTSLDTLDLSYTDVRDITPLKDLKGLRALYLSGTGISDLKPLRDLRNLTNLYLDSTRISDISLLRNLQNLTTLSLASDKMADWGPLKDLPNLIELDLSFSNMTDLAPLKNLKKLQSLSLRFTLIDQASIAELRRSLPNALIVP